MQKENQIESKIRILLMVTGILLIGLCVSFLRIAGFGVDPFSGMNLAISGFIGWSFGNWQLVINIVLLIIVFFTVRHCIGLGTIINMVFVGYIADFTNHRLLANVGDLPLLKAEHCQDSEYWSPYI